MVDDIEPYRWLKVIINAAINPITAILRARNGVILEDPNARALVGGAVVMEGVDVVNRLGIGLPSDPLAETLRVAEATRIINHQCCRTYLIVVGPRSIT